MLHGGMAERIVNFANRLVGHVRGGLGMSNVLGCTRFGGCAIGGVSVGQIMRSIAPFYGALLVTLLAVTYLPALSMALRQCVGG